MTTYTSRTAAATSSRRAASLIPKPSPSPTVSAVAPSTPEEAQHMTSTAASYCFKTESDARSAAHHLRVAADRYDECARTVALPRISEQFKAQADEARRMAEEIAEEVG